MILIAAVDRNWSIGEKGRLLVRIPADQQIFRNETMGKILVMGRKTFESIQGGLPLPGRTSWILTGDETYTARSTETGKAVVFHSKEELEKAIRREDPDGVCLIGGGEMYREFLPLCHRAEITWMDYVYQADTSCPNLDQDPEWELVLESEEQIYFDLIYYFRRYERRQK